MVQYGAVWCGVAQGRFTAATKPPGHAYEFNDGRRAVGGEAKSFFTLPTVRRRVKQAAVMAYSLRPFS
jgi:hypothetical protein